MYHFTTLSIGLGLVVSLIFSEFFGLAAGGMVVPGYMALHLHRPVMILMTLAVSFLTYFIVHSLSSVIIIYGRRRTALMILTGFVLGWFTRSIEAIPWGSEPIEVAVVGYIVPGLIAIWLDRQGAIETVSTLLTSSIIVRLILILIFGMEIYS